MNQEDHRHAASCRRHWPIIGLCALLLASASQAQDHTSQPPDDSMWLAASNHTLDQLRGGFEGAGFLVSFGISRAVYINDRLITSTSFQLGDIAKFTPAQAVVLSQQIASQVQLVQNGHGSTVETGAVTVPLATIQNTLNNQPLPTQTAIQASTNGLSEQTASQAQLVQNGPGNTVEFGALAVPLATYIQNTLNNQTLRTQTMIQASTNGLLSALRSMNLQATIREAVANAIANR